MVPYVVSEFAARVKAVMVWVRERCGGGECIYGWYTWFRCFG